MAGGGDRGVGDHVGFGGARPRRGPAGCAVGCRRPGCACGSSVAVDRERLRGGHGRHAPRHREGRTGEPVTLRLPSDWALLRRLLREARPYLPHIVGLFVIGLLATPLALLSPLPLKIAVDSALGTHPIPRALRPPGIPSSPALALAVAVGLLVATALLKQLQEV